MDASRRRFLKVLGAAAAGAAATSPMGVALARAGEAMRDEFFVFLHAYGAWDVTVGLDPRNAKTTVIDPASTDTIDIAGLTQWTAAAPADGLTSFRVVRPSGCNIPFGPAIGKLAEDRKWERLLVVNGLAMNTVSHPDGIAFSVTGRHLAGGKASAPSVDTVVASEMADMHLTGQSDPPLFPNVSIRYTSFFNGPNLDTRALPLRVDSLGTVSRTLRRSNAFVDATDREAVNALLQAEARQLAGQAYYPEVYASFEQQVGALREIHRNPRMAGLFDAAQLRMRYGALFDQRGPRDTAARAYQFESALAANAAFAVEAFSLGLARCVSMASTSFDTHFSNYEDHPLHQQELFNVLALMLDALDATAHPTLTGHHLGEHTHFVVTSDFCRTPQINVNGGRDHYPNGSCMIISPKFRGNTVYGRTDAVDLLPDYEHPFMDGTRSISPADVLATFVTAFGIDPRRFMRDGGDMTNLRR